MRRTSHAQGVGMTSASECHTVLGLPDSRLLFLFPRNENKLLVVSATIILDFLSHSATLIPTNTHVFASKRIILRSAQHQGNFLVTLYNGRGSQVRGTKSNVLSR